MPAELRHRLIGYRRERRQPFAEAPRHGPSMPLISALIEDERTDPNPDDANWGSLVLLVPAGSR